jgi:peptide/nickel transport system substrate-binding protein
VGEVVPAREQPEALRVRGQKTRIAFVEHGDADLTSSHGAVPFFPLVSAPFRPLHPHPNPGVFYLAFNANRSPFNHLRARQAVNFALDRNRVVQLAAGKEANRPTCQVLPPSFPAYQPYCPYTLPSADGAWSAPDQAKAARLVAASGTKGAAVTLWVPRDPAGVGLGRYLKGLLESLGYRVHLRSSFRELLDRRTHEPCSTPTRRCRWRESVGAYFLGVPRKPQATPQILWGGWGADYPAPSNFIDALFSCRHDNLAHYCDPALDRRIRSALRLQQTDAERAKRLWTKLDREVTDRALWVPLYNVYGADLVSKRVGNYRYNPAKGALLSQLWVR